MTQTMKRYLDISVPTFSDDYPLFLGILEDWNLQLSKWELRGDRCYFWIHQTEVADFVDGLLALGDEEADSWAYDIESVMKGV